MGTIRPITIGFRVLLLATRKKTKKDSLFCKTGLGELPAACQQRCDASQVRQRVRNARASIKSQVSSPSYFGLSYLTSSPPFSWVRSCMTRDRLYPVGDAVPMSSFSVVKGGNKETDFSGPKLIPKGGVVGKVDQSLKRVSLIFDLARLGFGLGFGR